MTERREEKWHVGKEIPIALILVIIGQTGAAIWWAASFQATVTTKLDDLSFQVAALTADKYTSKDAAKDNAIMREKFDNLQHQIDDIKRPFIRR